VPSTLDSALLTGWARAATQALERHCAEIDRINVFPVPDGDTGTNLLLTMRSAAEALSERDAPDGPASRVAEALAAGAMRGARGNSGFILSQVLLGVAQAVAAVGGQAGGGHVLADALCRAHLLATAAVSRPRQGTVLSVLAAAARAAMVAAAARLEAVAEAAASAAATALRATTGQLPELSRAGVVDAGGLGLYLILDALASVLGGRPGAVELPAAPPDADTATVAGHVAGNPGPRPDEYEVMYLLDGSDAERVAGLRAALDRIGDSVAVVGGAQADTGGLWNVHVHCADVGAAIEAGIAAGRPHRISVVRFVDTAVAEPGHSAREDGYRRDRAVLMVVGGPELAELARSAGADVVQCGPDRSLGASELCAALTATGARHVVLLPADTELTAVAERAASQARRSGQEVLVVPTASVLQGLAALAVHDPTRRPGEDVVAMAEAAAGTRTAGLLVAESEALTWVGRCEPGDVLGISDGEVVLIAPDLAVGGLWLAHRMLTAGGEIVTALLGEGVDAELGEGLAADLRRTHPEVDVVVHRGGQRDYPLVLGVE
jgi:DAK2 domain fusion protein YloV